MCFLTKRKGKEENFEMELTMKSNVTITLNSSNSMIYIYMNRVKPSHNSLLPLLFIYLKNNISLYVFLLYLKLIIVKREKYKLQNKKNQLMI